MHLQAEIAKAKEVKRSLKTEKDNNKKLKDEIEDQNLAAGNLQKELNKSRDSYKKLKDQYKSMKKNFEVALQKLKTLKSKLEDQENELEEIRTQNHKLSIRAAEGFENLTPRPSFEGFENFPVDSSLTQTKDKVREVIKFASHFLKKTESLPKINRKKKSSQEVIYK